MAHTKTGGVVKGNRNSLAKRLGVKRYGGESVSIGEIIVRQRGTPIRPGQGVRLGRDFTIYSLANGKVAFKRKIGHTVVSVL